jgi:hypothetical protein
MENSLFLQVLTLLSVLFVINCVCLCSHLLSPLSELLPVVVLFAVCHLMWSVVLRQSFVTRYHSVWIRLRYQFKILFIILLLWLCYKYTFCQIISCAFLNTFVWKHLQTSVKPSRNTPIVEKLSLSDLTTTYKTTRLRDSNSAKLEEASGAGERPQQPEFKRNLLPSKKGIFPQQDPYESVCVTSFVFVVFYSWCF